jgi:hypothetical protein
MATNADNEEAQGEGSKRGRGRARGRGARAEGGGQDEGATGVRDAIEAAGEELRRALAELHMRAQRRDFEARLELTREMQQAQFEQQKAAGDAHWELMETLRSASGSPEFSSVAFERGQEHERTALDRQMETQRRMAEAEQAYRQVAEEAMTEFNDSLEALHREHIVRLKGIWAALDPEAVEAHELATLAQMTAAAAQGMPVPAGAAGVAGAAGAWCG